MLANYFLILHREVETNRSVEFNLSFVKAVRQPFTRKILLSPDPFSKCQGGLLDCVHTMPAHFENGEKCDSSKI